MAELLRGHGIPQPYPFRQYSGITRWGARRLNDGLAFFLVAALGAPANVVRHKTYWRAQRASILHADSSSEIDATVKP